MNTEIFTGKAEPYAKARPGYPEAAIDHITSIARYHLRQDIWRTFKK